MTSYLFIFLSAAVASRYILKIFSPKKGKKNPFHKAGFKNVIKMAEIPHRDGRWYVVLDELGLGFVGLKRGNLS